MSNQQKASAYGGHPIHSDSRSASMVGGPGSRPGPPGQPQRFVPSGAPGIGRGMAPGGVGGAGMPPGGPGVGPGVRPPMGVPPGQSMQPNPQYQQQPQQQQQQQQQFRPMGGGGMAPPPMAFGGPRPPAMMGGGAPGAHHQGHHHQHQQQQHYHQQQQQNHPPGTGMAMGGGPARPPPPPHSATGTAAALRPPPFAITSPSKAPSAMSRQSSSGNNIDPSQMPRPSSRQLPTQVFETRPGGTHAVPPATDVSLAVRDTGDAGPRHMRCSVNSMPQGHDMVKSSSIPLVLGIQPFAVQAKGDSAIPLIDTRGSELVRCGKCNAYVCPGMTFRGGTMTCCFCGGSTAVNTMAHGDAPSVFGTVEYIVDGKYQVREPMAPTYMFLIDCTAEAVASGMTATVCSSVRAMLGSLMGVTGGGERRTRVGLITFTGSVQFYEMGGERMAGGGGGAAGDKHPAAKMLVMGDVEDPFCPLAGGAFVTLASQADVAAVGALLDRVPEIFAVGPAANGKDPTTASAAGNAVHSNVPVTSGESAGSAAVKAGVETLKAVGGGRLLTFLHSLPHKGALALKPRESGKPPSDRDPLDIMSPQGSMGKLFTQLARDAAQSQVCIDVFALTKSYVDLATISILSSSTGGSLYRYSPFSCSADTARFFDDLRWNLTRPGGLEAVGKLRVSAGLSVDEVIGSFSKAGQNDLVFPTINSDSTIFAKLLHDERLREGSNAYFQFATLYSTTAGQRRVRVHSMALPVTRSLGSVFRGADLEVYMGYLARQAAAAMPGKTLVHVRDLIGKAATGTLVAYRKHCASSSSSSGQLILPESLKLVPLFCLGLSKLPCFRTDARADSRAVWLSRIASLPLDRLLPAVHPRLFRVSLDIVPNNSSNGNGSGVEQTPVPESLPLSAEHLESDGVYILENGYDIFLYFAREAPTHAVEQLLGTPSLHSIDPSTFADLPQQENPLSKQTREVIAQLRRQRRSYMHMRLVVKGHPHETLFHSALVEDRHVLSGMSYVEYLCYLHRQIQNILT